MPRLGSLTDQLIVVFSDVCSYVEMQHSASGSYGYESNQLANEDDQRPDQLFIGGLPGPAFSSLPDKISSSDGFQGCLASIYLAGRSWSPCEDDEPIDIPDDMTQLIRHGCHGNIKQSLDVVRCFASWCKIFQRK
jgi:hypothetical protein